MRKYKIFQEEYFIYIFNYFKHKAMVVSGYQSSNQSPNLILILCLKLIINMFILKKFYIYI